MLQLGFSVSFTVSVGASPSEHLRSIRASTCLRSSKPDVCIHASSLSRIPGIIRAELAEILYHVETDPVRRRLALRSASEDVHISAESEYNEHFGEPGDPCWFVGLRQPQQHRNIQEGSHMQVLHQLSSRGHQLFNGDCAKSTTTAGSSVPDRRTNN